MNANSVRPPPPQGAPPPYAFVGRVYKRSLRPVVVLVALLTGIWTLISAIGLFKEASYDEDNNIPKIAPLAITLGAMYTTVTAIEAFGILAAILQRLQLVRIYAMASVLSALLIMAGALMRVIVHFVYKSDIIQECVAASTGETITVRIGIWTTYSSDPLSQGDAQTYCNNAWNHDSWGEIIGMLIEIFIAALFSSIAFSYYRQSLDPAATRARAPSNEFRSDLPQHYNPPYNMSVPTLAYAPPPGPPPAQAYGGYTGYAPPYDGDKLPGYVAGTHASDSKDGLKADAKVDPFGDGPSLSQRYDSDEHEERDVTSRPRPGERDPF